MQKHTLHTQVERAFSPDILPPDQGILKNLREVLDIFVQLIRMPRNSGELK
jgi:hypothetical protein